MTDTTQDIGQCDFCGAEVSEADAMECEKCGVGICPVCTNYGDDICDDCAQED